MSFDPVALSRQMMEGYAYNSPSMEDWMMVKGKVALVMGGTSGLGFCIAIRLLQGGANVILSSFSESEAETALGLLSSIGYGQDRVRYFKSDVTKEDEMEASVKFTADTFGSLDILVNTAGIWSNAHVYDMPEEVFLKVIDVNLNGTFRLAKHASKYMVENGIKGKMVFISSDAYIMPFPLFGGYPHYVASKGGVVALAVELARELKRFGISVNTVAPGYMPTPGCLKPGNSIIRSLPEDKKAELAAEMSNPQLDMLPETEHVARVAYMLCTGMADSINGETILANYGAAHGCKVMQPAIAQYPPQG